ncbi:Alpha/Beta hydrolase protein [Hyaloraphidium curvatum]|nr:Alpha/Beta hydrolase protein [Hyaloraphidium curvatum]
MSPTTSPYGLWESPISADLIASASVSIPDVVVDPATGAIVHVENRPTPAPARGVIVERVLGAERAKDRVREVNPAPLNSRTTVHEYGGGSVAAGAGTIVFSNFPGNRVYIARPGSNITPLTPESSVLRYADFSIRPDGKEMLCVAEDHTDDEPTGVVNSIVSISLETGETLRTVAQGHDFFSNPRYDASGKMACYLRWDHPDMPWTGSELCVKDLASGEETVVAGRPTSKDDGASCAYPKFGPDGRVYFADDSSGFWQLMAYDVGKKVVSPVVKDGGVADGEFGSPEWTFGGSQFDFLNDKTIVASFTRNAVSTLCSIDIPTGKLTKHDLPFTVISRLRAVPGAESAVFVAASPTSEACLHLYNATTGKLDVLKRTSSIDVDKSYISPARAVSFPTRSPSGEERTAYAFYYAPTNPDYSAPAGAKPPAVVKIHGGPTSNCFGSLSYGVQYWTTRGFAYLDLNYGGSTGYGREYRARLDGEWGVVDVLDSVAAAGYLAKEGLADPKQIVIAGGSAGGLTTLLALELPLPFVPGAPVTFATGCSSYGVADLIHLSKFTHKFELRYLDSLMGGPAATIPDVYVSRSPVTSAGNISVPLLVLQGSEDKVVPPAQSEAIVDAVRKKGGRADYVLFEGEGHGWRQAANIRKALETELAFYLDVLAIEG